MLKLSNRSSTVLYPARKITEFFQPVTSLPLRASNQPETARDRRASRDASSYNDEAGSSAPNKAIKSTRSSEGMTSDVVEQEITSTSRKRTRDGKLVDRTTRANASEAVKESDVANGDFRPQHRILLPAVTISEKASDDGKKDGEEKRSLRSKAGGTRLKSDLATYFPNFEDVVAGILHAPEFLTMEEPIQVTESGISGARSTIVVPRRSVQNNTSHMPQFERIDISALAKEPLLDTPEDPLNDDVFLPSHRRAERREKQLRNIEKERAQHEKGQLESLLESLQGPDWLRVMGITGITDGARKDYEPRRDYFVREVKALLRKFRIWKDAEKKLMLEKAARDEEEGEDEEDDDASAGAEYDDITGTEDNDLSTDDPDAWAARQLRIEARSAQTKSIRSQQRSKPKERAPPKPPKPPEPPKPFTSFFDKPHVRQAALTKGRHSARRTVLAFGHPVPELDYQDFDLPKNFMSREAMLANARKRRRMNREKKEAEAEAEEKVTKSKGQ